MRVRRPIAGKLLKLILSIYFIVVISVNAIQMIYQYYQTKEIILQDLRSSERIFGKGLGEAVWNFDENSLRAIIKGMLEHPSIVGIKVADKDGHELAVGGRFSENIPGLIRYTFSVKYISEDRSEREVVGEATVYSLKGIIFERIKGGYLLLAINTILVALTLCLTLLWVSRRYLAEPLTSLTRAVSELILRNLGSEKFQIQDTDKDEFQIIEASSYNEIGLLAKAFNQMIVDLKMYIHDLSETTAAKERVESKLEIADKILSSLRKVIGEVLGGSEMDYSFEWLVPHMEEKRFEKGEILFRKGDKSNMMFYVKEGALRLMEIDKVVGKGTLIGETGILSPLKERTISAVCEEDSELYTIEEDQATRLFYQDPSLVFQLIQMSIKRSIENLKKTVAEKERIEADLRIAHDIQKSMLPGIFPPFPGIEQFDIFASMEPAKEVGGDFYDFFFIKRNRLCFLIGDVSGKGVPAALFMTITKTLLKMEALRDLSPDRILYNVNSMICPDNETCMFVTILCAILDTDTGELHIGNAGHNPPLIYRSGQDFKFLQLEKSFVLGPMEDTHFPSRKFVLRPGDIIFFYTDGVTEAMDSGNELFSQERLEKVLSQTDKEDVTGIINHVGREIKDFAQGASQSDDITMLALRFNGLGGERKYKK